MIKLRISQLLLALLLCNPLYSQSKLRVFGHMTQGFAISDHHQIYGIPSKGTSDYQNIALQFRFDVNESNNFIVQLTHKRLGLNPLMEITRDIELDWGFFEHRPTPSSYIKFGKVSLPLGIFNEVRDVGVLIPFYRVPSSVYTESRISSEAIEGVVFGIQFPIGKGWSIRSDFFAGQFRWGEWANIENPLGNGFKTNVQRVDIESVLGTQLWLNTPLEGLRTGISGYYGVTKNGFGLNVLSGVENPTVGNYLASFEYDFDAAVFRAEGNIIAVSGSPFYLQNYYLQSSFNLWNNFVLNAQFESIDSKNIIVPFYLREILPKRHVDSELHRDYSIGLNYIFSTGFVMKLEAHTTRGLLYEDVFVNPYLDKPLKTNFVILSLATGF